MPRIFINSGYLGRICSAGAHGAAKRPKTAKFPRRPQNTHKFKISAIYLKQPQHLADIYNETKQIYIQGGIVGYGDYGILKVDSIVIITSMNGRTKRERPTAKDKKEKKKDFEHLFKEAREEMTGRFDMRA